MSMRADVPAYTADGLPPSARYRLEVERRIAAGRLPESRAERVTAETTRLESKRYRARKASRVYRDTPECGCGQRCGYIIDGVPHKLSLARETDPLPRFRAPAADRTIEQLHTLDPYHL